MTSTATDQVSGTSSASAATPLGVTVGGTGAATLTDHGILVGSGTDPITALAVMTNGQLPIGQTGADPAPTTMSGDATLAASGAITIANNAITLAKMAQMATASFLGRTTAATGNVEVLTAAQAYAIIASLIKPTESIIVACGEESVGIVAGTGKVSFRMPYAFTVSAVRASLVTAQTSGSIFTVDINESGTSIISTKLTIDNTELTSTTAATPYVLSDTSLADDAIITVDVDQIGDGTAKGLKIIIIGNRT